MKNTKLEREAYIVESEDNRLTIEKNKKVIIKFENTIPFLSIEQNFLDRHTMMFKDNAAAASLADITNTIADIDPVLDQDGNVTTDGNGDPVYEDKDSYIFITTVENLLGDRVRVYYDKRYDDMFVIPDTELFNLNTETVDPLVNKTNVIKGYLIGYGDTVIPVDNYSELSYPVKDNQTLTIPNGNIANKFIVADIRGLFNGNSIGSYGIMYDGGNKYTEKTPKTTLTLVDLGLTADFFVDNTFKFSVMNVIKHTLNEHRMVLVNRTRPKRILIPIPIIT